MNSSKSELSFNGWCYGIHRQLSLPDDRDSRQIVGDFIVQKQLKLPHGDTRRRFRRGTVSVSASETELAAKMIRTVYAKA